MAEGLLRHIAGDKYDVESAGTHPSFVNPFAIESMKEAGIDISSHRSKSVNEFKGSHFDYIITLCDHAKESCPYFPGGIKIHWGIEDPFSASGNEEMVLKKFMKIRNEIAELIKKLVGNS